MSLSLDGVDDIVGCGTTIATPTILTYAAWFNATSMGESDTGTIVSHKNTTGSLNRELGFNGVAAAKKIRFRANWSGGNGEWVMTTGFSTLSGWKWVMVTYDGGSTANDPIFYIWDGATSSTLTVGSGLTETTAPSGTLSTSSMDLSIGNEAGTARTFNGLLGEVGLWHGKALTAAGAAAVFALGVLAVPDSLFRYYPMDSGTNQDLSANASAGTITGAVAGENPPARPAGRKG